MGGEESMNISELGICTYTQNIQWPNCIQHSPLTQSLFYLNRSDISCMQSFIDELVHQVLWKWNASQYQKDKRNVHQLDLEGSPTISNTQRWNSWESRYIQVARCTCIERFEVGAAYPSDFSKRCIKTVLLESTETCWRWNWWLTVLLLVQWYVQF